ncbi:MAG: tetratricopeptide repeat protein [Endomicrobiia bacterium]
MIKIRFEIIFLIFFLAINSFAKNKYYELGLSAMMSEKYDIAEIMLKSSYLLNSDRLVSKNDYQTLTVLGHTYFLDQRYDMAKDCYYEITKAYDNQFHLIGNFMYAESCVYGKNYKESEKLYSEIELLKNTNYLLPYVLYGKIYTLFKLEKYTSVLTNILKFNEHSNQVDNSIKEQIQYLLSESWYKKGSLKDAQREFNKFIKIYKDSEYLPYVNLRLAQIFTQQKDYSSAINFLQNLSLEKFKGTDSEVVIKYNLGKILIKQKKYDLAEKIYLELLENKFNDDIKDYLKLDLGYLYLETQKYTRAIKILSQITTTDYKIISRAEYLLGLSYYCSNRYDESVKIFTKFINKYGRKTNLYDDVSYWLALSYMNLDKYQETISILKNLVDKKSSIYAQPAEFFLAKCYINTKEYELSKNILNKLLDKVKNEDIIADIYYELGQCYKFSCEYAIAEQYFEKNVTRKDVKGIESNLALADVYVRSQKYDDAEKIIKTIGSKLK